MTDRYLDDKECIDRLVHEWEKHGNLVVALDYDNTVYDFHRRGDKYENVINVVRKAHKMGCRVVIFSCSDEARFPEMKKYLTENDIPFDGINEDVGFTKYKCRKINYSILLCDRSGLGSAYNILNEVCEIVWLNRNSNLIKSKQDIDF